MRGLHACTVLLLWMHAVPAEADEPGTLPGGASKPVTTGETTPIAPDPGDLDNPKRYGPAFNTGAQTEFIAPVLNISSLVVGFDAVFMQAEIGLGFGLGGNPFREDDSADLVVMATRVAFPLHRGIRTDYSLLLEGGVAFVDPPEAPVSTTGLVGIGARFRAFVSPNIAVAGSLGIAGFLRSSHVAFFVGARPLGAASVLYFFR